MSKSAVLPITLAIFLSLSTLSSSKASLHLLNEDNWQDMLKGEWMIEFYAPWCPACKALDPVWREFASWSDDLGIKVGQIDVTESPGLSGRFMITALPTIYHVKDGQFRQYRGTRDRDEFLSFIEEQKWKMIESVSPWRSPDSVQMSAVSGIFKLSMVLRNLHTLLTEEYGLPYWASYVLFGAATVIFGTLLALFFVFIIDCVCPPKSGCKLTEQDAQNAEDKNKDEEEDEEDEEDLVDEKNSPLSSAAQSEEEDMNEQHTEENDREKLISEDAEVQPSSPVRQRRPRRAE